VNSPTSGLSNATPRGRSARRREPGKAPGDQIGEKLLNHIRASDSDPSWAATLDAHLEKHLQVGRAHVGGNVEVFNLLNTAPRIMFHIPLTVLGGRNVPAERRLPGQSVCSICDRVYTEPIGRHLLFIFIWSPAEQSAPGHAVG